VVTNVCRTRNELCRGMVASPTHRLSDVVRCERQIRRDIRQFTDPCIRIVHTGLYLLQTRQLRLELYEHAVEDWQWFEHNRFLCCRLGHHVTHRCQLHLMYDLRSTMTMPLSILFE
jgi:hypothetical protein